MATEKPIKTKTKGVNIKIAHNVQADHAVFFFNRFHITKSEDAYIIYLGAVLDGELFNSHIIMMFRDDVQNCFRISKDYISTVGTVSMEALKDWPRPRSGKPVVVANMLNLANAGQIGELVFSDYTIHDLAQASRAVLTEIPTAKVLVARSSMNLHRQFLGHYFHEIS
jgi:hypothetical protein